MSFSITVVRDEDGLHLVPVSSDSALAQIPTGTYTINGHLHTEGTAPSYAALTCPIGMVSMSDAANRATA